MTSQGSEGLSRSTRSMAALLFLGLTACYLCLTPATLGGRGYNPEELESGERMLEAFTAWQKGRTVPPMIWSRHGFLPVLIDLPFIRAGKEIISPDFVTSIEQVLFAAGLATLLYLWLRKICSPGMSFLLTFSASFASILWPYAYIGLETKQSFFVLLAGYLGLAGGRIRGRTKLIAFALTAALAISLRSTGITMAPAIAYVVYAQFRGEWRSRWRGALVTVAVMGTVWLIAAYGRNLYWGPMGGGMANLRPWISDSPLHWYSNLIGIFGASTKGLFVHAPALLLAIWALPKAFRTHRDTAIFAALVVSGISGLISLLIYNSEEVWGPRYLHVAICPLFVFIGAAWPRLQTRSFIPPLLVALTVLGCVISFLGTFFYYGARVAAMWDGRQNTMEAITQDSAWNEIDFSARLFRTWLKPGTEPVMWSPKHIWVWERPPEAPPDKEIDLRKYAEPQALMIRFWSSSDAPTYGLVRIFKTAMVAGILALALLAIWTWRIRAPFEELSHAQRLYSTRADASLGERGR